MLCIPDWKHRRLRLMTTQRQVLAVALFQLPITNHPIPCCRVDSLLGGGFRQGQLTELAGETASGKTQVEHLSLIL